MSATKVSDVRKIAVLRSNAIGDFLVTLPALEAVRHAYPQAEIVLLGQHWQADFLRRRPGPIDRVEVVPYMQGVYSKAGVPEDPDAIENFFQRMRQENFDIGLQLYGGGRYSNPFIKALNARITVGMRAPGSPPLDRWIPYFTYQSEVHRLLDVVSLIGAPVVSINSIIRVTRNDYDEAARAIPATANRLVVIHPGASDHRRRWPVKKFARTADRIAKLGATIVITGIESERNLTAELSSAIKYPVVDLTGKLTVNGLTGLLADSSLVISNDTGPLHLSRAVGTPTVGIYWVGNMINAAPVSMKQNIVHISWRLDCPVCGKNCIYYDCPHDESFVSEINEEDVEISACELFQKFSKIPERLSLSR
ncbi:MAG: glycosyltransferase family 9 protein [Candidatus Omnitrophota bacterium]